MRWVAAALLCVMCGCVQIDDGVRPDIPSPDSVPDVIPDGSGAANVDQVFLSRILADSSLSKVACMRYAAMYKAFAQALRERTDIPAMVILNACFRTSDQFITAGSETIVDELRKLESDEKSRDALAAAFERLSATCYVASLKK